MDSKGRGAMCNLLPTYSFAGINYYSCKLLVYTDYVKIIRGLLHWQKLSVSSPPTPEHVKKSLRATQIACVTRLDLCALPGTTKSTIECSDPHGSHLWG